MKIMYLSIAFDEKGDNLYNNLVDSLLKRNHRVTVVKTSTDKSFLDIKSINYQILNVKTFDLFHSNLIKKGINLLLIKHYFKRAIKKNLIYDEFDLILYATPPITLYSVINFCKKFYNARTFLMLKDIFPQNAVDLGMFSKRSIIYKYFRNNEKKYYKISDYIGCMSQGNVDYLLKYNPYLSKEKIGIFNNSIRIEYQYETKFNKTKTVFLFGGNLGKPQNLQFILNIIKKLDDFPKAFFMIVGKGTEQDRVEKVLKENKLSNLKYIEYLPSNEYEEILKEADVGLISLDLRFTIPNIPSKFQAYLRQKKPVLAITDTATDLKDMIINNDCGWWIEASNEDKVVSLIKEICENKEEQIKKGKNGFQYLIRDFNIEKNVDILEKFMEEFS